jgi:DNA primase
VRSGLVKVHDADDSANDSADDKAPAESQSAIRNSKFYDRFRNRVMFPICNDLGEVIAFSGRVLESGAASGAKYVNSPETMLFTKGNVLFGLHKSKRALIEKNSAIVCEGQLDLITAFEAGVKNVIAPQGTAFTDKQARILKRYVEEVVLCFDADAAGQKAAERSLASLLDASLFVRVAQMPDGHDPDSLIRELGAEAFVAQINHAKDFFDFQIDRHARSPDFATPRGRLRFAKKMAESVSLVADPVMRDAVINNVCARLEIPAGDFRAMLAAPRREELGDGKPAAAPTAPKLSNTVSLLCRIALSDSGARAWLLSQPWPELLGNNPECDLLAKILGAPLTPEEPTSLAAFMSGLHGEEEAIVSALLSQKPLYNPEIIAADCWREFERGEIQRRREAATSRMRAPGLPFGELLALQREVMDLQKRLDSLSKTDRSAVKRNP